MAVVQLNPNETATITKPDSSGAGTTSVKTYLTSEPDKIVAELNAHEMDNGPSGVHFGPGEKQTVAADLAQNEQAISDLDAALQAEINRATAVEAVKMDKVPTTSGQPLVYLAPGGNVVPAQMSYPQLANAIINVLPLKLQSMPRPLTGSKIAVTLPVPGGSEYTEAQQIAESNVALSDLARATDLAIETARAQTAEANKMNKIIPVGQSAGNLMQINPTGDAMDSGVKAADIQAAAQAVNNKMDKIAAPLSGKFTQSLANGNIQESTIGPADIVSAAQLQAEVTRATGAEANLNSAILSLQQLGHYLGSVTTYAALASFVLPASATPNDFVTVQADETHSGQVSQYVLTAKGPPAVWSYDYSLDADVTGKIDKIQSPAGGKLVISAAPSGYVGESLVSQQQLLTALSQAAAAATQTALNNEITRAQQAEANNAQAITNEATTARAAEAALAALIGTSAGGAFKGDDIPTVACKTGDWFFKRYTDAKASFVTLYKMTADGVPTAGVNYINISMPLEGGMFLGVSDTPPTSAGPNRGLIAGDWYVSAYGTANRTLEVLIWNGTVWMASGPGGLQFRAVLTAYLGSYTNPNNLPNGARIGDIALVTGANAGLYTYVTGQMWTKSINLAVKPEIIKVFTPDATTIFVQFADEYNPTGAATIANWSVYDATDGSAVTIVSIAANGNQWKLTVAKSAGVGVTYIGT